MNPLIYGRNDTTRIVSVEPQSGSAIIYRELETGEIEKSEVPVTHYILYAEKHSEKMRQLEGNQFFKYMIEYSDFNRYKEVLSSSYEKKLNLHVIRDPKEAMMCKDGYTYFKGMKVSDVSVLAFDIETNGLTMDRSSRVFLISNTFRKQGKEVKRLFSVDEYNDQLEMIRDWCNWVREMNPSILIGHNIYSFDLPYLNQCGLGLKLGRDGSNATRAFRPSQFRKDGSQSYDYHNVLIHGREIVDTMFLSMKYDQAARREYESYKLKDIIKHEGLEKKGRQFYDASQIAKNWHDPEERKKIKAYAADDADDTLALYDLMIPSFFYLTQSVPRSLQAMVNSATGSQWNSLMVRGYLQDGHSIPLGSEQEEYEGGISFGISGIHRNVFKIDVQAMYPSIILSQRICNREKDPKELFLGIMEFYTNERIQNKEKFEQTGERYYSDLADSQKPAINSGYGFLAAPKLNFNSPSDAARVTKTGRELLKQSMEWAESHGFILCNGDTDSIAFKKADEKPFSEEEQTALLAELNALMPANIVWKNDKHYRRFIVLKAKNYVLDDGKKVKLKGSALKGSKKEPALKDFTCEVIDLLLKDRKDQILFLYLKRCLEIKTLTDISPWCQKVTVTKKVLNPEGTFQKKILAAIGDTPVSEGDKVYLFNKPDGSLCLREKFTGEFDPNVLMGKLRDTLQVFENVLDVDLFPDLTLKRSTELLTELGL